MVDHSCNPPTIETPIRERNVEGRIKLNLQKDYEDSEGRIGSGIELRLRRGVGESRTAFAQYYREPFLRHSESLRSHEPTTAGLP
jgi:hypothetical protein